MSEEQEREQRDEEQPDEGSIQDPAPDQDDPESGPAADEGGK